MTKSFEVLDLSTARNVYAVGDIHGMFTTMTEKLAALGFDPELDHLISVGDLVDRGPESHRAAEFCDKSWFHWVRGNHEELTQTVAANMQASYANSEKMKSKGQGWLLDFDQDSLKAFSDRINDAPVILEVITPSGKRCGFVHATFPSDDWRHAEVIAEQHAHICLWDRTDIHDPKPQGIRHIDYVFHGHTPLSAPRTVGNVVWLDTGAYRDGGKLTIVKLP